MPADSHDPLLLANQICFALYSTQHAMTRVYRPLLEEMGLTYPQYIVMLLLWEEDNQTVKSLGGQLHLDSGTLTPLLKRLEAQGFVRRSRDPADERLVRIQLTPDGAALREQAACIPSRIGAAAGRTHAELATMRDDLRRLQEALDEAAGIPA